MSKTDFQNGFALGMISGGVVEVIDTTEIDALETLIDESGVLEDTEGTVTEKVEQLIDKVAYELKTFECVTNASQLFYDVVSFPNKAVVNLPNASNVYQAFAYWKADIPIVEEITINAPSLNISHGQPCMGQMFTYNGSVKKVILNTPDESQYMNSTFSAASLLEEIVLDFSTKNIIQYESTFSGCKALKKILGVLDFSSATKVNRMFDGCTSLEEVTFAPNTLSISISLNVSSKLSAESVQSIFDGLATVETAQTLTLNGYTKILQSQVDSANAKGWTVAGGKVVSEEEYYG